MRIYQKFAVFVFLFLCFAMYGNLFAQDFSREDKELYQDYKEIVEYVEVAEDAIPDILYFVAFGAVLIIGFIILKGLAKKL